MNYSEIIAELNKASGFDLYRLQSAINLLLEDPNKIIEVKRLLQLGQVVEYFYGSENRAVAARLLKFRRSRVVVENLHDKKRWDIPYFAINIHQVDTQIVDNSKRKGLNKTEISVGDMLGFVGRDNVEQYGEVTRLNQKTVTLTGKSAGWRVPYSMLFKVHEQAFEQLAHDVD